MNKKIFFIVICLLPLSIHAQQFPNISSKWDAYYTNNPSPIEKAYSASDFIKVMDYVGFVPSNRKYKAYPDFFKKALLALGAQELRQMMIDGSYYSRSMKHDDYFQLYNLTYHKISKQTWDDWCAYLIPLMSLDDVITLH